MKLEKYEEIDETGRRIVRFVVWDEDGNVVERDETIPPLEDDLRSALKDEYNIE